MVGVVIVAVIAAAVAVTIILYQLAIADAGQARAADLDAQRVQQLAAVTARQRICMIEYLTTGSAAALSRAQALDTQFDQVFGMVTKGSAAESQALADASESRTATSRRSWPTGVSCTRAYPASSR